MPPNAASATSDLEEKCEDRAHLECPKELQAKLTAELNKLSQDVEYSCKGKKWYEFGAEIKWINTVSISVIHILFVYHILTFPYKNHPMTVLWFIFIGNVAGIGVTAGAHRYWTHRSYKANIPFRILLAYCFCTAGQNSIYNWVRDHRVHHKFSETDADPHNAKRGFFFSHVGWLMLRKHPEVIRKGREIDMSDVMEDPVVAFTEKYFMPLKLVICFIIPVILPVYLWNETWYLAIVSHWFLRYVIVLNVTWSVNSAAHIWGNKPYDKNIAPAENRLVSFLTIGEGWHNYHHVFPWDYKAAEFGGYGLNFTTAVIDFFAMLGWVYDRKKASPELVRKVIKNKGDGSHIFHEDISQLKTNVN